jgi:Heterokaryon incompatibility protein (HET)
MPFTAPALEQGKAQIRLLRLLPCEDAEPDVIRCSLYVVNLDDKPSYAALSYTWQPVNPQHDILINQQLFPVDDNLWQFLSTTTQALQEGNMSIWVDQVCIDQHNMSERNNQVSLMGRVYSQAYPTLVWLGPEAENSNAAMSFLNDLWHTESSNAAIINKYKQLLPIDDLAEAVTSLFLRPYWFRLWIVQEFWLSPYLIFLCGSSTLHFHENSVPRARAYLLLSKPTPILQLQTIRFVHQMKSHPPQLAPLIFLFGNRECSKPHDRVFGLIGHTSNKHQIPVDYSIPIEKLALSVLQTCPTSILNSFDRKVARSILSGCITNPVMLNLISDVLFHIARGIVPFAVLIPGRDNGSEELSRMCQEIIDSMKGNLGVNMKYIEYDRNGRSIGLDDVPCWFFRRRLGRCWAMRGVLKPQTPAAKLASKNLTQRGKQLARSRSAMIKITERYIAGVKRTWLENARITFKKTFLGKGKQEIKSDAHSGLGSDGIRDGVTCQSDNLTH